jgi:hypothetical protein
MSNNLMADKLAWAGIKDSVKATAKALDVVEASEDMDWTVPELPEEPTVDSNRATFALYSLQTAKRDKIIERYSKLIAFFHEKLSERHLAIIRQGGTIDIPIARQMQLLNNNLGVFTTHELQLLKNVFSEPARGEFAAVIQQHLNWHKAAEASDMPITAWEKFDTLMIQLLMTKNTAFTDQMRHFQMQHLEVNQKIFSDLVIEATRLMAGLGVSMGDMGYGMTAAAVKTSNPKTAEKKKKFCSTHKFGNHWSWKCNHRGAAHIEDAYDEDFKTEQYVL